MKERRLIFIDTLVDLENYCSFIKPISDSKFQAIDDLIDLESLPQTIYNLCLF